MLVTLTLSDPSFTRGGTKPNTALTMAGVPKSADATAGGTAKFARIKEGVRRAVPLLCGLGLIETMRGPQRVQVFRLSQQCARSMPKPRAQP